MVNIKINDVPISVEEGTTILEACREAKMIVPTLCYLKDINEIGACRVCVVEVKGIERLVTSCNHKVKEGMEIYTNTPKVRDARRINIKMILSQHNCFCPTCVRSGNCQLQKVANDLEFGSGTFKQHITEEKWPMDFPLIRDESKCIKCMRCIQICDKVQSLKVWDIAKTGSRTTVNVSLGRNIKEADCALCGQCITHCPVAALSGRDDKRPVFSQNGMLNTRRKTTVVQVAPAVRTAWAEAFRLSRKFASPERLAGALRLMGFDYVFDTTYAADLTIMEEGAEILNRLTRYMNGDKSVRLPILTSCCPAWVNFFEHHFPDMLDIPSTARSPQQMFGSIAKTFWAEKMGIPREKLVVVSIMPCLAKKYECDRNEFKTDGSPDVDYSISTRELARLIRRANVGFTLLTDKEFDQPMGASTGAGVIFGTTGGVMEAALRSVYEIYTGRTLENVNFEQVRGLAGVRRATIDLDGFELKVGIAHGLGNARHLLEDIRHGRNEYHVIEIMACPGGCIGGGGQPLHHGNSEVLYARANALYREDAQKPLRKSHENPYIKTLYEEYLGRPLSETAERLLHTHYFNKAID